MNGRRMLVGAVLATALMAPVADGQVRGGPYISDYVTSTGSGDPFSLELILSSGPNGEEPFGSIVMQVGGGGGSAWQAAPHCLRLTGNVAIVGFSGYHYFAPSQQALTTGIMRVVDRSRNGRPPDRVSFVYDIGRPWPTFPAIPPPTDCAFPGAFAVQSIMSPPMSSVPGRTCGSSMRPALPNPSWSESLAGDYAPPSPTAFR